MGPAGDLSSAILNARALVTILSRLWRDDILGKDRKFKLSNFPRRLPVRVLRMPATSSDKYELD